MLTQEMVVTIHVLHKQGKSIRAISDELGMSRNTVRKYLRKGGAMSVYQRSPRPSRLDPYKAYLQKRIHAAAPDWFTATVLYRERKELGYQGTIRVLRAYV